MKVFDADKTRMIGLPYVDKNYDDILSRFHLIPERHGHTDRQTDGRTDRQTDRIAISLSRVSVLTRDKNSKGYLGLLIGPDSMALSDTIIRPNSGRIARISGYRRLCLLVRMLTSIELCLSTKSFSDMKKYSLSHYSFHLVMN